MSTPLTIYDYTTDSRALATQEAIDEMQAALFKFAVRPEGRLVTDEDVGQSDFGFKLAI
jgi:hypothetical protein